jgi:regulator of protease activity HflC (stomatin/prohibitin superfamily)
VVTDIKGKLTDVLASILRIEVSAVQINALDFSPQYKDAINQATLARTKTFAAQQDAERAKIEAQTGVIQAQAEADAQAARADGQARAQLAQAQAEANGNLARARAEAEGNLLKARADAEALRLRGEGDAAATRARIEAAGGTDNYVRQIDAQSKLRWNGQVPNSCSATAPTPQRCRSSCRCRPRQHRPRRRRGKRGDNRTVPVRPIGAISRGSVLVQVKRHGPLPRGTAS